MPKHILAGIAVFIITLVLGVGAIYAQSPTPTPTPTPSPSASPTTAPAGAPVTGFGTMR
jgi:hypothetical protein